MTTSSRHLRQNCTIAFFLACSVGSAQSFTSQHLVQRTETVYSYFPSTAEVHGVLKSVPKFGPPGYGETPSHDAKVHVFVLTLDQVISVRPAANADPKHTANLDPFSHLSKIQLEFKTEDEEKAAKLINHHMAVSGTFEEAVAPGIYTNVALQVNSFHIE